MENFVFPDEIKRKLMKMSKLMNIFLRPIKFCEIAANWISFYWCLFLWTPFTSTFRGQDVGLLSCK